MTDGNIRTGRIFFGRCSVMAKGLGETEETEHRPGLHLLAQVMVEWIELYLS